MADKRWADLVFSEGRDSKPGHFVIFRMQQRIGFDAGN